MKTSKLLAGTIAYTIGTFTLAVLWHVVLFKSSYDAFGYFEGEPSFALGFLTILIQGLTLSVLYHCFSFSAEGLRGSMKFVFLVGLFFWTSHVLAFLAKQEIAMPWKFLGMETFYLGIQFAFFGFMLSFIFKSKSTGAGQVDAADHPPAH